MDLSILQWIFLFLGTMSAGIIDSVAGGGGLITIPVYLSLGVSDYYILGTNKTVSTLGGLVAIYRYIKNKAIYWKAAIVAVPCSLASAHLGARLSAVFNKEIIVYALLLIIPLIFFLNHKINLRREHKEQVISVVKIFGYSALIGLGIGFYDGFFGPGTGTFMLLAFFMLLRLNLKTSSATARIVNFSSNISSFIYFAYAGKVMWSIAAVAIMGSALGNFLGSHLVLTAAKKYVAPVFKVVLFLLLLHCLRMVF